MPPTGFWEWLTSSGLTPLEVLTVAALGVVWQSWRKDRAELVTLTTRYQSMLESEAESLKKVVEELR